MDKMRIIQEYPHKELTEGVIGAAIDVHRELGPGLLESAYESALSIELADRNISFQRQLSLPVMYKGRNLDCGYRLDMLVDDRVIIELKSVEKIQPIHEAQLLTYLRMTGKKIGLLINFNVPLLKQGIVRKIL